MTSVALHPQHECAPRVIRTGAMALAISLNLVALLIALQPMPLLIPRELPSRPAIDVTLQQHPFVLPLPPLPILHPVHHITHAAPVHTIQRPAAETPVTPVRAVPVDTAPTPVSLPATQPVAPAGVSTGNNDATIAYETATPPAYPVAELRNGIEGTVLLRVLVDVNGRPLQVLIVHGSGSHALDQAAREHVLAAWRFHPAQRDGRAIQAWAQVPVKFSLSNR